MIKTTLEIFAGIATLYLIGFAFVIGSIMAGGAGDDSLSQHYKGVIIWATQSTDVTGHNN